jgi:hypothetical protein
MINKSFIIDGIQTYEDPYLENDKILQGRCENKNTFIIANPKTLNILYNVFINNQRKEKFKRILNENIE